MPRFGLKAREDPRKALCAWKSGLEPDFRCPTAPRPRDFLKKIE